MVDFNNEATVATPPGDVVKIVVLERREQCIEAIESYYNVEATNLETHQRVAVMRARVMAFWYQVQAMAYRRLDEEVYESVVEDMRASKKADDLLLAFEWLNSFVDEMGLTMIDTRAKYDRTRVEDANKKKGL